MPLFASVIFQQLYNLADSFVAGKFIGENALAAVGNGYEITLIYIAIALGCNIGCSVVIAKLFGAKQYQDVKTAVSTALIAGGILCVILMVSGLAMCTKLLQWIHTPDDVFADSRVYLNIYLFSLPFVFSYNISTGIFSALGDSKTPFWFLVISSVSNIGMDVLFVTVLQMGVAGVAWATFLCQGVSCLLAVCFIFRRLEKIRLSEKPVLFSWCILRDIIYISVPSILQQSFVSVGNIAIQGIINTFGSSVMAGYSAAIKLNNLMISSFTTLANGISNYTAQNIGAGKMERLKSGFRAGMRLVLMLIIPLALLYFCLGRYIMYIFLNDFTGVAMDVGVQFLRITTPFYLVVTAKFAADGVLRGAGKMKASMAATFIDLFIRVLFARMLGKPLGTIGIWLAWPVGWSVATVLSVLFYKDLIKKTETDLSRRIL